MKKLIVIKNSTSVFLLSISLMIINGCEPAYETSNSQWYDYSNQLLEEKLKGIMKNYEKMSPAEYCSNCDALDYASRYGFNQDGSQPSFYTPQRWVKLWYNSDGTAIIYRGLKASPYHSIAWTIKDDGWWDLKFSPSNETVGETWKPVSRNEDKIIISGGENHYYQSIHRITSQFTKKDRIEFFAFADSIKNVFMAKHKYILNKYGYFEKSNEHWKNGKKHGKWLTYYQVNSPQNERAKKGSERAVVVGKEQNYEEGVLTGPFTEWYTNNRGGELKQAHIKDKESYKNGKLDGLGTTWYENGQKRSEGAWKNHVPDGKWTYWYENGQKKRERTFKNGEKDGLETKFYEKNGLKKSDGTYKNGELVGSIVKYPENENTIVPFIPEFIFVEGGSFEMGVSQKWINSHIQFDSEIPMYKEKYKSHAAHTVTLSDFYIGKTEVTFKEYDIFCEATGYTKPVDIHDWGRGNRPVYNVSWDDAVAYCEWLSNYTGKDIRLPTEAEWEYAARGGNKSKGYFMSGFGVWTDSESKRQWDWRISLSFARMQYSDGKTGPVGLLKPNELGICDMTGNVAEWCSDWYGENYYMEMSNGVATDPVGPPSSQPLPLFYISYPKVVRGGDVMTRKDEKYYNCVRDFKDKSYKRKNDQGVYEVVGFRCVMVK